MRSYHIHTARMLYVLVAAAYVCSGCIQPLYLGTIGDGTENTVRQYTIAGYTMKITIVPGADTREQLYTLAIRNACDGTPMGNVRSAMSIKKYCDDPMHDVRHKHDMLSYIGHGVSPNYDSSSVQYIFAQKFKSTGKYELTIRISEVGGSPLRKDVIVSFDHVVL